MNFTNIAKIKNRLISIIDSILLQYDNTQTNIYGLDQTKLQQWCDLLKLAIINKQNIKSSVNNKMYNTNANINSKQKFRSIQLPKISKNYGKKQIINNKLEDNTNIKINENTNMSIQFKSNKLLQIVNSKKLILHQFNIKNNKNKQISQKNQYQFTNNTLHRFCSIVQIQNNKFIIAGGCQYQNPLIKTNNILLFQCEYGQIKKIGKLLQPISSHASIFIHPNIYFIGGKKNQGIITKTCSYYNILTKQTEQIAALNYTTASTCLVSYKNKYIYKIGGIGQCFGELSISPYIERYNMQQDIWDVINPYIPTNMIDKFNQFQLYAHSLAYISDNNEIVMLGGFDIDKKNVNFGCIIQIKRNQGQLKEQSVQNERFQQQEQQVHQIKCFGQVSNLENGGFWTSQLAVVQQVSKQNIYALLATTTPTLNTKVIKLAIK